MDETTRWTVRACPDHGLFRASARGCPWRVGYGCPPMSEAFEVVRAVGARTSDPDTSKQAAFEHEPRKGSQRARALQAIREAGEGGRTAYEVEQAIGLAGIWKRISELKQGGHIIEAGTRRNRNGAEGTVFVAASVVRAMVPSMYDPMED